MAAVVVALGALGAPAHADDPHDLFGLKPKKPVEPEDGKPADPLDNVSPYGLVTHLTGEYLQRVLAANRDRAYADPS